MDSKLHSLPPMKRFMLLQQEYNHRVEPDPNPKPTSISPSKLPTKKRKQSYCLPAKKRVWAYTPPTTNSPLSKIDLNVDPDPKTVPISPSKLPAKKRIHSRYPVSFEENLPPSPPTPVSVVPAYSLPAKKRVLAFRPHITPTNSPLSTLDEKTVGLCPMSNCLPAENRVLASPTNSPLSTIDVNVHGKTVGLSSMSNCLPAKKRVWAVRPEMSPTKTPSSNIDLNVDENVVGLCQVSNCLPAKKRVWAVRPEMSPVKSPESKIDLNVDENVDGVCPVSNCLPTKKRVWAIRPEISPVKSPESKIDLNVEYTPSPEKKLDNENANEVQFGGEIDENEEEDGILCAVCESTDGDPNDPIVFCDGCELMVHSNCYGNPLIKSIPEGDWFCAQCADTSHLEKSCCLCPVVGGAMKPTNDGRWAHIVCAVLVPEVFFEDSEGRDGIDCSQVPKRRWKEVCYLCKKKSGSGCAIECSEPRCPMSFHVTCGLKEDLCIELKEGRRNSSTNAGGIVAAFCGKHTEIWEKQQQTGKFKIVARNEE